MLKFLCECRFLSPLGLYQGVWFLESKFSFVRNCYLCACSVVQLCPTPCDPMDCSPPVHGIFQARILEWGAIFYSRGSSQPRDQAYVSCVSYTGRQILYHSATWEVLLHCHPKWLYHCALPPGMIDPVVPKLYQRLTLLVFGISAIPIDVQW